jgi:hypothetical protein
MADQSESLKTKDHDTIRRWAEERGGRPVKVKGTEVIELDFPGYSEADRFEEISWDEWFRIFDERGLTFVYQEKTADGEQSNFNQLVEDGS